VLVLKDPIEIVRQKDAEEEKKEEKFEGIDLNFLIGNEVEIVTTE
jgi:hypothetical protein